MTTRMNPNKTRDLDSLIFPQPFIVLVDLQNSYFSECQILNQNVWLCIKTSKVGKIIIHKIFNANLFIFKENKLQ